MSQLKCKILLIDDRPENIEEDINSIVKGNSDLFEYIGNIKEQKDFNKNKVFETDILVVDYCLEGWDFNGDGVIKKIKEEWHLDKDSILYSRDLEAHEAVTLVKSYNLYTFFGPNTQYNAKESSFIELNSKIYCKSELKEKMDNTIIGNSNVMNRVKSDIIKLGPPNITVLILGESGTGKELVARALHKASNRANGPFVAVNCAAIPRELIESELFGYKKGAFTGATESRAGKFEQADGGTIFLDEIGDMDISLQAKILRIIQEREFYRVGGKSQISVDVRIIAATNHDLEKAVREKMFREDLFYRLNVITIPLPPLKERREDIPLLADYFLKRFSSKLGSSVRYITDDAMRILKNYDWKGNVRELENVIQRAIVISVKKNEISKDDIPMALNPQNRYSSDPSLPKFRKLLESNDNKDKVRYFSETKGKKVIERIKLTELSKEELETKETDALKLLLDGEDNNKSKLASRLGISRQELSKKLKKLTPYSAIYP